jgi:hypothetical protein
LKSKIFSEKLRGGLGEETSRLREPLFEDVEAEEASDPDRSSSDENDSDTEHKGPYKIPKVKHTYTKAQVEEYRRDFSSLAEKSDEFIRSHSVTELIRLDNKLGGGKGKGHRKLTERMARNLDRIKKIPTKVEAGLDNRGTILHKARFLPGATGLETEVWTEARKVLGLTGVEPISKYDFVGTGLVGKINSALIARLHNPGEKDISIKMFSNAAIEAARGASEKDSHPTRDFESYHDLRMGLATLRLATHQIFWWDFSVECLDYFMNGVKFGETLFGYRPDQSQLNFVTDFIDQVLHINSERWDDQQPYMDNPAIRGKWQGDIADKFPKTVAAYKPNIKQRKDQQSTSRPSTVSQVQAAPQRPPLEFPPDLCKKFQFGNCVQTDKSCKNPFNPAQDRLHLCSYYFPQDKRYCRGAHTYNDHRFNPQLYK